MVYQGEAFCPGHVTAFFEVVENSDPRRMGSRGAGLCLSLGVRTVARVREASRPSIETFVNEKRARADVTRSVVTSLVGSERYEIKILSDSPLPVAQGFGVSAAAALSTALAIDDALSLGRPREDLVTAAHVAEVEARTGLGDVVPASMGGMDLRLEPGAPGHADVRKFDVDEDLLLAVLGPEMPTRAVLQDARKVAAISRSGGACVRDFAREPTFERLFDLGNRFAEETDLAGVRVREVTRAIRMFGRGAMAMLGNSVFATGDRDQLASILVKVGTVLRCEVENKGAHVV